MFKNYIKSVVMALAIVFIGSTAAIAQDDFNKGEFFGGYMMQKVSDVPAAHGFSIAGTYNFNRYAGIKGEYSFGRSSSGDLCVLSTPGIEAPQGGCFGSISANKNTFMGGIQIKDNATEGSKVRPFAHVLAGMSRGSIEGFSETKFSMAIGGGIDLKVSDRVSVRMVQFDYHPIFIGDGFGTQNAIRLGFGIVVH